MQNGRYRYVGIICEVSGHVQRVQCDKDCNFSRAVKCKSWLENCDWYFLKGWSENKREEGCLLRRILSTTWGVIGKSMQLKFYLNSDIVISLL